MIFWFIIAYTAALTAGSGGDIYICSGQPQTFLCEVPKQGSLARLEWRIDFNHEDIHPLTGYYISYDLEGHIIRDDRLGVSFVFNLTSNSPSSLVSAMILTANDTNATTWINNATVNCAVDEAYPKVLHVNKGITVVIFYR